MRAFHGSVTALSLLLISSSAFAGGFEIPDNGTEALGRGAAFTAKADDGTAIQYNIAGLAQQRGTRVLLNGNIWFSSYEFQRSGSYIDDPSNSFTPWGRSNYPKVGDQSGAFLNPFIAASTDFGYFERWTFAFGAFGPSNVGNRTYPESLGFAPNPGRYDVVENHPQVIFATAAAAVKALPWLDFGVAFHYVIADLHVSQTTTSDALAARGTAAGQCANAEYQPCDARATIDSSSGTPTAAFGAMVRPMKALSFGLNFRGPAKLETTGDVNTLSPRITPNARFDASPVTFVVKLPSVLRVGARYAFIEKLNDEKEFERADIELDGTWENWGNAQDQGLRVDIPHLSATNPPPGVNLDNISFTSPHAYHDTWSLRLGGAYNIPIRDNTLSLRAGVYHDSSATPPQFTRLDFDTLDHTAATLGVGFKVEPFELNVAWAEIFDATRTVTGGEVRPVNGALQGRSSDAAGNLYAPVNGGEYSGHSHIISVGATMHFDGLIGAKRH